MSTVREPRETSDKFKGTVHLPTRFTVPLLNDDCYQRLIYDRLIRVNQIGKANSRSLTLNCSHLYYLKKLIAFAKVQGMS